MLSNENIICFSSAEWVDSKRTSKRHLMEIFSRTNKVLYVETLGSRIPGLNKSHLTRVWTRMWKWLRGPRRPADLDSRHQLLVYSPAALPFYENSWVRKFNRWFLRILFRRIIRSLGLERPILWFYLPTAADLIGELDEKLIVYHLVDEWSTYPGYRGPAFQALDEKLLRRSDIVFASNRELAERKKMFNKNVHFLPHGVHVGDFQTKDAAEKKLPEDIAELPKPVLAMIGSVSGWTDWDILAYLARRHPEWSVALIGTVGYDADLSKIRGIQNIHLLGPKSYAALADYYRAVDVCLISFQLTEHIRYCCPTRLYEHLAAGKPVVSTDFPAAGEIGGEFVKIARSKEEFEEKVRRCLAEKDPAGAAKRREWAAMNTWDKRAEEMSKLIIKMQTIPVSS